MRFSFQEEVKLYDLAITNEDLDSLNNLWDQGSTFDDFSGAKAVCASDPKIRDWVIQKKYKPDYLSYLFAMRRKRFDVLEWLYDYGVPLTRLLADCAIIHKNIYLLEWFESKGILPTQIGKHYAIEKEFKEIVEWLDLRKIDP